jgi:hypothetical protein
MKVPAAARAIFTFMGAVSRYSSSLVKAFMELPF